MVGTRKKGCPYLATAFWIFFFLVTFLSLFQHKEKKVTKKTSSIKKGKQ